MGIRNPGAIALVIAAVSLVQSTEPTAVPAPPSPEQAAARQAQALRQNLGLTEEQMPAVEAALLRMIASQRETLATQAQAPPGAPPQSLRAVMRSVEAAQTEAKEALRGVLGAEQLAGFDGALRDQRAAMIGEAMTVRIEKPVGLVGEQRERIVALFTEHARASADLIAEHSSNGRTEFGAARAMRGRALELQRELERQLAEVLTPDQLARYHEAVTEAGRSRGAARSAAPR